MTEDYTIEKALIDAHNPTRIFDGSDIWCRVWCAGGLGNASENLQRWGGFAVGREGGWRIWHWPISRQGWKKKDTTFDDIIRLLSDPEYQQRYGITP